MLIRSAFSGWRRPLPPPSYPRGGPTPTVKHVRLALGRSGVGGRFPRRRRRRRLRRCSPSCLGSLTLSFSFSSSPCCFLSSRSCSLSTPIRFAHCFFAGCCSIGVSSSIEATLGPSAASNCYPVRFCYVQHLDCSYLPQPFPSSRLLWPPRPPPPLRSRGELCVDLRSVNGGLNAIPPPLVPPRPAGSTRAACL